MQFFIFVPDTTYVEFNYVMLHLSVVIIQSVVVMMIQKCQISIYQLPQAPFRLS